MRVVFHLVIYRASITQLIWQSPSQRAIVIIQGDRVLEIE
jgi:hypothetical protein